MVGRLIKEEKIRPLKKKACKGCSHLPATAQGNNRLLKIRYFKSQAQQNLFRGMPRILLVKPAYLLVDFSKPFCESGLVLFAGHTFQRFFHPDKLGFHLNSFRSTIHNRL